MSIEQKYTLFNEYLDSVFYSGYSDQLATEQPDSYIFQFEQFKKMYA